MTSLPAVDFECSLCTLRHVLLLPHLLPLDTMFQVEPPQASHSDSLVSEMAMKEFCSIFERKACPFFKSLVARQEVNMMLFELGHLSIPD